MAEVPMRALFNERQILGSADLNLVVEHERRTAAQLLRALTTAGVVSGLNLVSTEVPVTTGTGDTVMTKQIRLLRGVACDDLGRLVVVPEDVPFGEDHFLTAVGSATADEEHPDRSLPHPVFLAPEDRPQRTSGTVGITCSPTTGPTRVAEGYRLRVGRPGEELPRSLPPIPPGAGPDEAGTGREVLLGFVRLHLTLKRYVEHADASGTVARRYAGLRSDTVNGRQGRVVVQTSADGTVGMPALALDSGGDNVLTLGRAGAQGDLDPLFWIDAKGDVFAKGQLHGTRTAGQVAVESGVVNHGLRVPLPAGVTDDEVTSGRVVLHVSVTPLPPPVAGSGHLVPTVCDVSADRRVTCRFLRLPLSGAGELVDGSCRYLAIASVSPSGSGS